MAAASNTGTSHPIDHLLEVMARLRDPQRGCPWDREQEFSTIAPYTIEEAYEVADAIARNDMVALKDELGDLLFAIVNLARRLDVDPEQALRSSCRKFDRRFRHMETAIAGEGSSPSELSLDELEARWQRAKAEERRASIVDPVETKER